MYYDGDIDLEDIECRLYSQVYHSNNETEDTNITLESNGSYPVYSKIQNRSKRYFSKTAADHSIFIPLQEEQTTNNSEKTCSSVHNSISVGPNSTDITSEGNFANPFQNNITVNQYTVPLIINPELNEILNPGTFFVPWAVKNQKLLDKKVTKRQKRAEKRRRNKEKRNQNIANAKAYIRPNVATHFVYISDDSDGECVVASEMCKKTVSTEEKPRNIPENVGSESDDDIIYIPPPPVEIINIDVDNEEDKTEIIEVSEDTVSTEQNKSISTSNNSNCEPTNATEQLNSPESCTTNDFLDNPGEGETSTNKFNFSLHGADFNSTGDFARPANPVDYCETESSCSTNDFNKDNNSVKTIVFNEVDFPKEDIFSDKNLESFSTYITPKRSTVKKSRVASKISKPTAEKISPDEESLSSSESDYESPSLHINARGDEEYNKKLPTLSPMQCAMVIISNAKNDKKSVKGTCCSKSQESTKRKSNTLDSTDSESENEAETELPRKLVKKKKRTGNKKKNLEELDESVNTEQQNANSVTSTDVDNATSNDEATADTNTSEKCAKKKIKNSAEKAHDKEKCVKDDISTHTNSGDCSEEAENIANTSRKKKKKNSANSTKFDTPSRSSKETTVEKVKRKKKKSVSSENLVNDASLTELNRSRVEIEDIGNESVENEISSDKNSSTSNSSKKNDVSLDVVIDQPQEKEKLSASTAESENKVNKATPRRELENMAKSCVETICNLSDSTSVNVSQENEDDEEIIVVDEPASHKSRTNLEECIEIMESSDSDYDFTDLADVGPNIELANCSINLKQTANDDKSHSKDTSVKNKDICEDYSKFDVAQIQGTQSDDPQDWKISAKDRLTYLNPGGSKGPRCNRCRHFGHIAIRCPEKPNPPNCSLCGFSGHQEPRCPHKRCTQCGNEGDYSTTYCWKCVKFRNLVCRICNMKGHISKFCPDLWRRYHLTTEKGPIVVSQKPQLKPRDQLWCSGCAKQGHLEHECNYYNREYPPTNPCIVSYEDVLNQQEKDPPRNKTPTPPPPPVWTTQEQSNLYQNASPFPNFPSTSHNISYNAPILPLPLPLIPQIPNLHPMFSVPTMIAQNGILPTPNIIPHNNFQPVSTRVLNPFSVLVRQDTDLARNVALDQMLSNYLNNGNDVDHPSSYQSRKDRIIYPHVMKRHTNELLEHNQTKVKQIIMSTPSHVVKEFLSKELDDLDNAVSQCDPRYLRKKLFKYDKISKGRRVLDYSVVKEKFFWDRILNMYIFGVHGRRAGRVYMDNLRAFLSEPKQSNFDGAKRKSLLTAYNYIFDGDRHNSVNYYRTIQELIDKYERRR